MPEQSTMPLVHIYLLLDPISFLPRYVGQTRHPQTRLRDHLADRQRSYKVHWIQKMRSAGHTPLFEVIDVVPLEQADDEERFWIEALRNAGHNLVNGTTGGGNGFVMSADARARISAAAKIRPAHKKTPEECAAISARQIGRLRGPLSEAHRAKLSAVGKGRKYGSYPKERVQKVADILRGRTLSAEHRAKMSAGQKGLKRPPRTPEHCAKISAANKGRIPSSDTRAKIAIANTGRTHTPETKAIMVQSALKQRKDPEYRARMSQSCKEAWARRRATKALLRVVQLPSQAMTQLALDL